MNGPWKWFSLMKTNDSSHETDSEVERRCGRNKNLLFISILLFLCGKWVFASEKKRCAEAFIQHISVSLIVNPENKFSNANRVGSVKYAAAKAAANLIPHSIIILLFTLHLRQPIHFVRIRRWQAQKAVCLLCSSTATAAALMSDEIRLFRRSILQQPHFECAKRAKCKIESRKHVHRSRNLASSDWVRRITEQKRAKRNENATVKCSCKLINAVLCSVQMLQKLSPNETSFCVSSEIATSFFIKGIFMAQGAAQASIPAIHTCRWGTSACALLRQGAISV